MQISSIESELSKARAADENAFSIQVLSDRLQEAKAEAANESDKRAKQVKELKDDATKAKAAVVDARRSLDLSAFLVCGCLAMVVGVPMCRAWKRALAQSRSDRHAANPATDPVTPQDVVATIYHCLGIGPDTELTDSFGRPFRLYQGEPIKGILA